MAKSLYTAKAHVTGGRDQGHGVTSDGTLDIQLRTPVEMGGGGGGTNPEQLFAVGYAACFEGALGVVGRRERVDLGAVSIDSAGELDHHREPRLQRGRRSSMSLFRESTIPDRAVSIVATAREVGSFCNATARQRRGDAEGQRPGGPRTGFRPLNSTPGRPAISVDPSTGVG